MTERKLNYIEAGIAAVVGEVIIKEVERMVREGSGDFMYSRESYNLEEFFE